VRMHLIISATPLSISAPHSSSIFSHQNSVLHSFISPNVRLLNADIAAKHIRQSYALLQCYTNRITLLTEQLTVFVPYLQHQYRRSISLGFGGKKQAMSASTIAKTTEYRHQSLER